MLGPLVSSIGTSGLLVSSLAAAFGFAGDALPSLFFFVGVFELDMPAWAAVRFLLSGVAYVDEAAAADYTLAPDARFRKASRLFCISSDFKI